MEEAKKTKASAGSAPQSPALSDAEKKQKAEAQQLEMQGKAFQQSALGKQGKKTLAKRELLVKAEEEYGSALMDMMILMKRNGKKTCGVQDSNGKKFVFLYGVTQSKERVTVKEDSK